jgi:hypothetical protein
LPDWLVVPDLVSRIFAPLQAELVDLVDEEEEEEVEEGEDSDEGEEEAAPVVRNTRGWGGMRAVE